MVLQNTFINNLSLTAVPSRNAALSSFALSSNDDAITNIHFDRKQIGKREAEKSARVILLCTGVRETARARFTRNNRLYFVLYIFLLPALPSPYHA